MNIKYYLIALSIVIVSNIIANEPTAAVQQFLQLYKTYDQANQAYFTAYDNAIKSTGFNNYELAMTLPDVVSTKNPLATATTALDTFLASTNNSDLLHQLQNASFNTKDNMTKRALNYLQMVNMPRDIAEISQSGQAGRII
jgi:hypothetical protein